MLADLLVLTIRFGLALDPLAGRDVPGAGHPRRDAADARPDFDIIAEARQLAISQRIGIPSPAHLARDTTDDLLELIPALRRIPRRRPDQQRQLLDATVG
jgi:hypothetical protein